MQKGAAAGPHETSSGRLQVTREFVPELPPHAQVMIETVLRFGGDVLPEGSTTLMVLVQRSAVIIDTGLKGLRAQALHLRAGSGPVKQIKRLTSHLLVES